MKTMVISEFKAKCISVLKSVHETGKPLLVTWRGKPLVQVESVSPPSTGRKLGVLKGWIVTKGDIVHTSSAKDWEALT